MYVCVMGVCVCVGGGGVYVWVVGWGVSVKLMSVISVF